MAKMKVRPIDQLLKDLAIHEPEYVRTGCLSFDLLFRGKGIPLGSLGYIHGLSGCGKSTLVMTVCRGLVSSGHKVLFGMVEPSTQLAVDMGLTTNPNFSMLNVSAFSELEELFNAFLESDYTLLVIDSITAMSLDQVMTTEIATQDQQPASSARVKAEMLKMFQSKLKSTDKCVLCVAQERANFNKGWTGPETTMAGGNTDRHWGGYIVSCQGMARDVDPTTKAVIGTHGYYFTDKNRYALPFVKSYTQTIFGKGTSNIYALDCFLRWKEVYVQSGSTFKIKFNGEEFSVKGRVGLLTWIKDNYNELADLFYAECNNYFDACCGEFKPA